MATININIPVDKEVWVLNGLALQYNYQETIENPLYDVGEPIDPITNPFSIPNPQSKAVFIKEHIMSNLKKDATEGHLKTHLVVEKNNSDNVTLT